MHFLKVNSMQAHTEAVRNSTRPLAEDKICSNLGSHAKYDGETRALGYQGLFLRYYFSPKCKQGDAAARCLLGPPETTPSK